MRALPIAVPGLPASLFRRPLLARLRELRSGCITVREGAGLEVFGDPAAPLRATVTVRDGRLWRDVALGGSVAAAEAYRDGAWDCDDLVALFRIFTRDAAVTDRMEAGLASVRGLGYRVAQRLRDNTRAGSRRNIREHYDLGDEMFALFLDDTMTYSAAYFESPETPLRDAQVAKLDRICRELDLQPGDRLLEIGGGWGSFAVHAAARYGARVTTTTISAAQHAFCERRVREAGLDDRVTVLRRDYRDLDGAFDKLASIEMIEAVGHRHLGRFFTECGARLVPGGAMVIQAITMADQRYERARRRPDFIRQHVFPGSTIPSVTALVEAATRASDLRLLALEDLTAHYARTMAAWRERFGAHAAAARRLGRDRRFRRFWDYYLAYCEAGFRESYLGSVQMKWARSSWRSS